MYPEVIDYIPRVSMFSKVSVEQLDLLPRMPDQGEVTSIQSLCWPRENAVQMFLQFGLGKREETRIHSSRMRTACSFTVSRSIRDESVGFAGKLVIETKIRLYIHYIYSHTTNLYES